VEFDAILDTGFTGFISMPLLSALPLGLMLYGTVSIELADGSRATKLTAKGLAAAYGEERVGVVVLEPTSNDILLGMAFLRLFGRAIFVSKDMILLVDESRTPDQDEPESHPSPEPTNDGQPETPTEDAPIPIPPES
jgi:predicted aspartyl protease